MCFDWAASAAGNFPLIWQLKRFQTGAQAKFKKKRRVPEKMKHPGEVQEKKTKKKTQAKLKKKKKVPEKKGKIPIPKLFKLYQTGTLPIS